MVMGLVVMGVGRDGSFWMLEVMFTGVERI